MAAVIAKNELVAAKREIILDRIYQDGSLVLAPRGTDFMALGAVYVLDPSNLPHYKVAVGTMVNQRRPLTFTSFTFTADSTTDKLNKVAHGLETGDGPIGVSNAGGGLPAPLAAATDYWVIKVDADNFYVATSLANAYAGTRIDITTNGTGTQTAATRTGCSRGLDGRFVYQFTQAETNMDTAELSVIVEGTGYSLANGGGIFATANVGSTFVGFDAIAEAGRTYGDLARMTARVHVGKFTKAGNDYTYRDLADTKNSHSGTVVAGGRTASTIIDPT